MLFVKFEIYLTLLHLSIIDTRGSEIKILNKISVLRTKKMAGGKK